MLKKSPSGALSPYYYKGGYFHGIHYGGYSGRGDEFKAMMDAEEKFIMSTDEKRRIMADLYETDVTGHVLADFTGHVRRLSGRIVKLGISGDKKTLRTVRKALLGDGALGKGQMYFSTDMEDAKTWLVSD